MTGCEQQTTETFIDLLKSAPHWEFEILLMVVFDLVLGAALLPFLRRHWSHHRERDKREGIK
jgi:hypothetical protein